MSKFIIAVLTLMLAAASVFGQNQSAPTLKIVTEDPNLPSELYYGNVKVKPVRLRPGTNTPITIADTDFFVQQQYVDFLSRFPDASGFAHWQNVIDQCGTNAKCREVNRINVSGAFFLSIEFRETGYLVERVYKAAYGDATGTSTLGGAHQLSVPVVRLSEFLPDTQQVGRGVVVGRGAWQAQLEANKQAFALSFVQRPAFQSAHGGQGAAAYVDSLFANAGATFTAAERQAAVNAFGAGGAAGQAAALRSVAESQTLHNSEFNRAFVLMQYFGYLKRDPDAAPDTNFDGYNHWLGKLNQFGGDFVAAEMVKAFISSSEYRTRF